MKTGPTEWWFHQFLVIAAGVLVALSGGAVCAQNGYAAAGDDASPFSSSAGLPPAPSLGTTVGPLPLRATAVLVPARRISGKNPATKIPTNGESQQVGSSVTPKLRLDSALARTDKPQMPGGKLALPQGELNRIGIVRATAVRVRDGAFFLVGDYFDHEGHAMADSDAVGRN